MSQCAAFIACQRPFRSGCLVPGSRGAWYGRFWAERIPEHAIATTAAAIRRQSAFLTASSPLFRSGLLGFEDPRALEQMHHAVVPLMAGVFEDRAVVPLPRHLPRPR